MDDDLRDSDDLDLEFSKIDSSMSMGSSMAMTRMRAGDDEGKR